MRAHQEELFRPVALLHRVSSVDEAVSVANDSPFGLGGAVFTGDDATAMDVAERLDVGMVGISGTVKSAPDLPFSGVQRSGTGRELGRSGLEESPDKKLLLAPMRPRHEPPAAITEEARIGYPTTSATRLRRRGASLLLERP